MDMLLVLGLIQLALGLRAMAVLFEWEMVRERQEDLRERAILRAPVGPLR